MTPEAAMIVRTSNEDETVALGEAFGKKLKPNDVILLSGLPGAGKTWFTKGLAKALGVMDLVNSPSFSLINEYKGVIPLYHFDLYRLGSCAEVATLGCEEYFSAGGVSVFEWPERCPDIFTEDSLTVKIEIVDHTHRDIILPNLSSNDTRTND